MCVSVFFLTDLEDGTGLCVGEGGRTVEPQDQILVRKTHTLVLYPPSVALVLMLPNVVEQPLIVEPVSSFQGQEKA